jgi:glutamate-1-semialdehyde aminotransferase
MPGWPHGNCDGRLAAHQGALVVWLDGRNAVIRNRSSDREITVEYGDFDAVAELFNMLKDGGFRG